MLQFYRTVQKQYGIIGLLVAHNILNDPKLAQKLVKTEELQFQASRFTEESARFAFKILLENVLLCFRALKDPSDLSFKKPGFPFWFSQYNSNILNDKLTPAKNM